MSPCSTAVQRRAVGLDALFAEAAAGRGGALVLRGEPGVGKTALLTDAVSRADVRVLWTQGFESEFPLAFAGLHRLLRPILGSVERLPRRQADALLIALGERDGQTGDRFGVFLATLSLLTEAAGPRPVVVVVDDAQWLDEVSAEALLFVARRVQSDRVAVVFAAREGDVRRFDGRGLDEMTIGGLDATAAGALLAERTGRPVSDDVRDILLAHTGGNPLALVELPTVLSPPQLTRVAGLPTVLPLTAGVERGFLDRCLRLTAPAQTWVLLAAADDSGLVAIIQQAAVVLRLGDQALAEVERSGLVRVNGAELHFRHPLVRSAVYAAATVPERQQAHRALAAALEAAGEPDRRAWHLALATEGPDEPVARRLEEVAARSEHRGGHAAASAAWERAAALSPGAEDKGRRLFAAAASAWYPGSPAGHAPRRRSRPAYSGPTPPGRCGDAPSPTGVERGLVGVGLSDDHDRGPRGGRHRRRARPRDGHAGNGPGHLRRRLWLSRCGCPLPGAAFAGGLLAAAALPGRPGDRAASCSGRPDG